MLGALPVNLTPSPALWEVKCIGLILIFIYTFFKFAWAYRLFNYVAILFGAMLARGKQCARSPWPVGFVHYAPPVTPALCRGPPSSARIDCRVCGPVDAGTSPA